MSYFGTDQSQVQRILADAVWRRAGWIAMNGSLKVPQFLILFIGVMVFVFYQFDRPPVFFNQVVEQQVRETGIGGIRRHYLGLPSCTARSRASCSVWWRRRSPG
ncbi:MAG: hypothetical protein R3F17_08960 [Planctomycetota bacterium]